MKMHMKITRIMTTQNGRIAFMTFFTGVFSILAATYMRLPTGGVIWQVSRPMT